MNLGKNIVYYRKKLSITQEELAEKLYVTRQTVSRWENGSVVPDLETAVMLCETFGCDLDTLVRGDAESGTMDNAPSENEVRTDEKPPRPRFSIARNYSKISSVVMLVAIFSFCVLKFGFGMETAAWLIAASGALICGIASIIAFT
jgi:DNA-binding XRE family transcriptional regulator